MNATTSFTSSGLTAPKLQVTNLGDASISQNTFSNGGAGFSPYLQLNRSRGTVAGDFTIIQTGDAIGRILFSGSDGSAFQQAASIRATVDATPSAGIVPGNLTFLTTNSSGALTERMRIDSMGNVGIGTTTPTWLLNPSSSSAAQLALSAGAGVAQWAFRNAGGNLYFATTTVAGTATTSTSALTILGSNGNVGIGSSTPTQTLSIAGGGVALMGLANGAGTAYICTTLTTGILSTSTTACNPSSLRFKENIANLSYGLADVLKLRATSYTYKPGMLIPGNQVGFIAEEVATVIPEVVGFDAQGLPANIDYAKLTPVLTKAIQQLAGGYTLNDLGSGATSTVASWYQGTSMSAITVDETGHVGVMTNTPQHALEVNGDVGAHAFIAPTSAWNQNASEVGFATTTAPSAVLTADGQGVNIYKLAIYNTGAIASLVERLNAHETRIASLEDRIAALEDGSVTMATSTSPFSTSTLASALSSFGVMIGQGIAQFNTLVFRELVASADSDGTSSAGNATILEGNTVVKIENTLVKPSTKVFVTFNGPVAGSWYVSDKQTGSFRVILTSAQSEDVSLDYFLVQTEGQLATPTPSGNDQPPAGNTGGNTAPTITLIGDNPLHLSVGATYADPGVVVSSGIPYVTFINGTQQEISPTTINTSSPTTYTIVYQADTASVQRTVIVGSPSGGGASGSGGTGTTTPPSSDTTGPVVTLNGAAALELTVGAPSTDPGATATDDVDGDLTSNLNVSGTVDTATKVFTPSPTPRPIPQAIAAARLASSLLSPVAKPRRPQQTQKRHLQATMLLLHPKTHQLIRHPKPLPPIPPLTLQPHRFIFNRI